MKIRVCKTYTLDQMIWEHDSRCARQYSDITYKSDYNSVFETEDVDEMTLLDYINKGYAIKINC